MRRHSGYGEMNQPFKGERPVQGVAMQYRQQSLQQQRNQQQLHELLLQQQTTDMEMKFQKQWVQDSTQQNSQNQNQQKNQNQSHQIKIEGVQHNLGLIEQENENQGNGVAATNPAVTQGDTPAPVGDGVKDPLKKKVKVPSSVRRKRLNMRLSRVLAPKSALMILHEFKPNCKYKVEPLIGTNPTVFTAQVEHEDQVIATGQGMSKQNAKNIAAENAIKVIATQMMSSKPKLNTPMETEEADGAESVSEEAWPLTELASFAMYKLFSEWQSQGADVPLAVPGPSATGKAKKKTANPAKSTEKQLPANAETLHPTLLLNIMRTGIPATELSRQEDGVVMGYDIDGVIYQGKASNKKEARKEAAKAVLAAVYNFHYPNDPVQPLPTPADVKMV